MKSLLSNLLEECDLWKLKKTYTQKSGEFLTFTTPKTKSMPFLNIAIPFSGVFSVYKKSDLESLDTFFSSNSTEGFIPFDGMLRDKKLAIENSHYFHLPEGDRAKKYSAKLLLEDSFDIQLFANLVMRGFGFDELFSQSFAKRMESLSKTMSFKIFIPKLNGKNIGCISYFKKKEAPTWFMMNTCILSEYRKKGYGKQLILESIKLLKSNKICARTNNPNMEKLLRSTGFLTSGKVSLISLKNLIKDQYEDSGN